MLVRAMINFINRVAVSTGTQSIQLKVGGHAQK